MHHLKTILLLIVVSFIGTTVCTQPAVEIEQIKAGLDSLTNEERAIAFTRISGRYLLVEGAQDSALIFAEKALMLSQEINYPDGIQKAYYFLGMHAWHKQEDYPAALSYFEKSKASILKNDDLANLPTLENAIGAIQLLTGAYEEALASFQSAVDEAIKYEDYATLAISTSNQAIIYNNLNDTIQAIETNLQALEYLKKDKTQDQTLNMIMTSLNLSDLYRRRKDYKSAESTLDDIRPIIDSIDYFVATARYNVAWCHLYNDQGKKEELYAIVEKNLPAFKDYRGYDKLMYTSMQYYYAQSLLDKGKVSAVNDIINEFIGLTGNTSISHKNNLYQYIYDLSSDINDFKTAFKYLDKHKVLNDSLLNEETKEKVIRLEKLYQLEKKEREILMKEKENVVLKRRNVLLASSLMGLLLIGLLSYLWVSRKRQQEKDRINQIEQKMLSLQMNPHFIFNAISSIQNFLFDEGDTDKAIHHLSVFATLMRQILEHSRKRLISLEDEIEFIRNYLNLQKLRFDNRFDYELNIGENINPSSLAIPPLLTQPFIENAIEHGKVHQVAGGKINLKIQKQGDSIALIINDNGIGLHAEKVQPAIQKESLSIPITRERLGLLSSIMNKKFTFKIIPNKSGAGTTVHISIPDIAI